MLLKSKFNQSYKQSSTKIKYVIQYGIASSAVEPLIKDLQNKPFTFTFDETTTS